MMNRYKTTRRVLGVFAALSFAPAVFAQTAQDPAADEPSRDPVVTEEQRVPPSGETYGQEPQNQERVPEMTDAPVQEGTTVERSETTTVERKSQAPTASSQRVIRPEEVQQVFGQQASLIEIKSLSADETRALQQRLKDLGYYKGEIDGAAGPQTRTALNALVRSQFMLTQRLVEQGQMPSSLAQSLGLRSELMPTSGSGGEWGAEPDLRRQPSSPGAQPQQRQGQPQPQGTPRTNVPPEEPPSIYDSPAAPSAPEQGTQGSGTQGSGTQGSGTQGSGTQGSGTHGSGTQGAPSH